MTSTFIKLRAFERSTAMRIQPLSSRFYLRSMLLNLACPVWRLFRGTNEYLQIGSTYLYILYIVTSADEAWKSSHEITYLWISHYVAIGQGVSFKQFHKKSHRDPLINDNEWYQSPIDGLGLFWWFLLTVHIDEHTTKSVWILRSVTICWTDLVCLLA